MKLPTLPLFVLLTAAAGCEIHFGGDDSAPDAPTIMWAEANGRTGADLAIETPFDFGSGVSHYEIDVSAGLDGDIIAEDSALAAGYAGDVEVVQISGLRPGIESYLSVTAIDYEGNRSQPSLVGPIVTDFDYSGAIFPPSADDGDNAFGYQIASGDWNGDGHSDVAVSAPFKSVGALSGAGAVYIYFGSPAGLELTASAVIDGGEAFGQLGNAIAVVDWNRDGRDDLALGSPFADSGNGLVTVFDGRTLAGEQPVVLARLTSDGAGFFAGAAIGFTLEASDLDGDGTDELAVGAVAGNGTGAVLVVFDTADATGELVLSDTSPSLFGASVARLNPPSDAELYGLVLADLGAAERPGARGSLLAISGFQTGSVVVIRGADAPPAGTLVDVAWNPSRDLEFTSTLEPGSYFGAAIGSIETAAGRDIAIGAYRANNGDGMVALAPLDVVGSVSIDEVATLIVRGEDGAQLGTAIANGGRSSGVGDVDRDGTGDLVVVGGAGAVELYVWYGDRLPAGEGRPRERRPCAQRADRHARRNAEHRRNARHPFVDWRHQWRRSRGPGVG